MSVRLFRRRRPTPQDAATERREAQARERVERIQQRERQAEANVAAARARAALEATAAARAAEAEGEAFRAMVTERGHWFPTDTRPASRSRLSGRPTFAEKLVEAIRVGWDVARRY